jgi:hypothetical protein
MLVVHNAKKNNQRRTSIFCDLLKLANKTLGYATAAITIVNQRHIVKGLISPKIRDWFCVRCSGAPRQAKNQSGSSWIRQAGLAN